MRAIDTYILWLNGFGADGYSIGTIAEVYVDNQTGRLRWAAVTTGGPQCPVPLTGARVDSDTVWVPVTSAPHHDPGTTLTIDDEHDFTITSLPTRPGRTR